MRTRRGYKYGVALSFAGPQRPFAEAVAEGLLRRGIRVFYDKFEEHELWGRNLHEYLASIYNKQCRYCIMLISQDYLDRMWTTFERQHLIDRLSQRRGGGFALPVRLDNFLGEVPGLPQGIGYLSVSSNRPDIVVSAFLRKIGLPVEASDPSDSYNAAIHTLTSHGALSGCLIPDETILSLRTLNRRFPPRKRIDVQILQEFLGFRFYWRKRPNQTLILLAADVSSEDTSFKEICEITAPEQWNGLGRWTHSVITDKKRRIATGSSGGRISAKQTQKGSRKSLPQVNSEDRADDEDETKAILICIYLQSPDFDTRLPDLSKDDLLSKRRDPLAAFLGAFLFKKGEKVHQFYYLSSKNFQSLE